LSLKGVLFKEFKMETNKTFQKRSIAYKLGIDELIKGKFVREDGWQPSYIITENGDKVSRINLIGIAVSKSEENEANYQTILIEDGGGKIPLKMFGNNIPINNIGVGSIINLIGRIREFNKETYISPEIIKKIENPVWVEVRKLELKKKKMRNNNKNEDAPKDMYGSENACNEKYGIREKILSSKKIFELIRMLDKGDGVEMMDILKNYKENDVEKVITNLLKEGEIFEFKKGKLKILE